MPGRYAPDVTELKFLKSTFCGNGACVEVRISREHDYVLVRDSRGDTVTYNHDEWQAFLAGCKAGEFDV